MLENVPLHIVQTIVGHFDERMTMMYANHATAKIAQEKMANMPNYLKPDILLN